MEKREKIGLKMLEKREILHVILSPQAFKKFSSSSDVREMLLHEECKCQYKNVGKVENNNVCFCYSSADCVSIRDRTSLMRYDGPFMEIIVE